MKKKDKANRRYFNEKRPNPANIRLSENIMKTSWRQLSSLSSRRRDQGEYIHLSLTSSRRLQCVFKTSCQYVFNILQDVFNTSLRHLQDVWSRHLQDLLKTSSRRLAKMSSRHLQDVFKTYSRRFQDVFNTFKTYCEEDYLQKNLPRPHVWQSYGHGTNFPWVNSLNIPKHLE